MPYMPELRLLAFCGNVSGLNAVPFTELTCINLPTNKRYKIGQLVKFFAHQTIIKNTGANPFEIVGLWDGFQTGGFTVPVNFPAGVQLNWGYNPAEIGIYSPNATAQFEILMMAEIVAPLP